MSPQAERRPAERRPAARRPAVATVVATVLVLVIVASGAVVGVVGSRVLDRRAAEAAGTAAAAAAAEVATSFTTLDHRTFDEDVSRVVDGSTGPFLEQFTSGIEQTRQLVTENEAVSTGSASSAAVVSADDDVVQVLVAVDAQVSNAASPTPVARQYRVQLEMELVGDRWLAADLAFVG